MPDFDDSLGGQTLGGDDNDDRFEKSLGEERTMGGDTDVNSLGDASTLGDANIDDDLLGDGIKLEDLSERYTEEGVLGKGGMGEVLLATDTRLDRQVAIKRILGKAARSKTASQRFLTEAKSIAALNHNNIVQIYDYGRSTEGPFLIMECVQGGSLLDKCKEGPIELEEAVNIFSQLCDGLAKAHAANIIHRDIKPANVLMTEDGVPKLTDFGLAKDDTADTGMTMEGAVIGTLDFMPPEQREGAHLTDHRSDLWSLAATFYQMLTGKSPKVINLSAVPANLQPTLGKSLEENKEDRYQSAIEMKEAVQQAAVSGLNASRDLGEGECPKCGTINSSDRKFCRNPDCAASLEVECLSCKSPMPMWEAVCGSCGDLQKPLIDEALAGLQSSHDQAESHLQELEFDKAAKTAATITSQTDLRLQKFASWHEEFTQRLEQSRSTEHERLREILLEATAHEMAYDYEAGLRVLEQVAPSLKSTEVDGHESAETIRARIDQLVESVAQKIAINNTRKIVATKYLEVCDFDGAIENANTIESSLHPQLKEFEIWVKEFIDQVLTTKESKLSVLSEQLSELVKHQRNHSFDDAVDIYAQIDPQLRDYELEGLGNAKAVIDRVEEANKQYQELLETNKVSKEKAEEFLSELKFEKAIEEANRIESSGFPQLEEFEVWRREFLETVYAKRSTELSKLAKQISEAVEHEKHYRYADGVESLELVPSAMDSTAVDGCEETVETLRERLSFKGKRFEELDSLVVERWKKKELTGLLLDVTELFELNPNRKAIGKLKDDLEKRQATLLENRDTAFDNAQQYLADQKYGEAVAAIDTIKEEVWNDELENFKVSAEKSLAQLNKLRNQIATALKSNQLLGLIVIVEECLELKNEQKDLLELRDNLIQREEKLTQRNRELCDQAIIAIKQSNFDAAIALLGTIKRQDDDPTSRKLRQFLTQIKEKRSTLIADTKRAMHAGNLHSAKTLIELYFKRLEQFGEVKDEQISGLLATVQARMKRQLFFKTAGICLLIAGIITWASSSVYEHFKLKTALAEGDYETALNIDPSNDVALKLQDRSQRIEDALKSNDFMRALRIDGSNKQAREMKLQADREAENKALAERRIEAAANIADEAIETILISEVNHIAFSPDGKTIACASAGDQQGEFKLPRSFAVATEPIHRLVVRAMPAFSVAFSPDGKTIASAGMSVKVWESQSGRELNTLTGHTDNIWYSTYSPDGKTIASASKDMSIKLWDSQTGDELKTIAGHSDAVYCVAFSPDGKMIASGSSDNSIKLWDSETGDELKTLTGHSGDVLSVAFSPDGRIIASGSKDGSIKLWDSETGDEIKTLTGHTKIVWSVAFSPDGKTIASGSDDRTIKLWDSETGIELKTLTGHSDGITSVAFSPDGKTLASGSFDKTIKLWDVSALTEP